MSHLYQALDLIIVINSRNYQVTYAINSLYQTDYTNRNLATWFYTSSDVGNTYTTLTKGFDIYKNFRNLSFSGNTKDTIALTYHPAIGCMRVLDPIYQNDPTLNNLQKSYTNITNPLCIKTNTASAAQTTPDWLHLQPSISWCYFFQKADLARQNNEWDSIVSIYADSKEYQSQILNSAEYVPLLLAELNLKDFQQALILSEQMSELTPDSEKLICDVWQQTNPVADLSAYQTIIDQFHCNDEKKP